MDQRHDETLLLDPSPYAHSALDNRLAGQTKPSNAARGGEAHPALKWLYDPLVAEISSHTGNIHKFTFPESTSRSHMKHVIQAQ